MSQSKWRDPIDGRHPSEGDVGARDVVLCNGAHSRLSGHVGGGLPAVLLTHALAHPRRGSAHRPRSHRGWGGSMGVDQGMGVAVRERVRAVAPTGGVVGDRLSGLALDEGVDVGQLDRVIALRVLHRHVRICHECLAAID